MFVFYVSVRFSSTTSTPTSRKWAKTQRISSRCSLRWAHHHYYYYNNYYCYYQSSVYFSLFWQTFSHVDHFFVTWFRSWRASVWIFPMMQLICPSTGPRTDTPTSSHVTLLHISSRWFSHTSVQRRVCVCVLWWWWWWILPPDDFSRVKLVSMHNDEGSDYVNANFIPVSLSAIISTFTDHQSKSISTTEY